MQEHFMPAFILLFNLSMGANHLLVNMATHWKRFINNIQQCLRLDYNCEFHSRLQIVKRSSNISIFGNTLNRCYMLYFVLRTNNAKWLQTMIPSFNSSIPKKTFQRNYEMLR
jgi:hypothetical protein